jgi:type VI secretion system secreted protein Hcp
MASVDYFLKIDGVPGESMDAKHKDEIQVESFSFGAQQSGTMAFGGGGGAGKVQMGDFVFVMNINRASPSLFQKCASGEHIKHASLTARKAGKDQQDYFKVTFEDVMVSDYQTSGKPGSSFIPTDAISLNFAIIRYEYKTQNADGTLGPTVKTGYDLKQMRNT